MSGNPPKLVDRHGNPPRMSYPVTQAYEAASTGRRMSTWGTSLSGPNDTVVSGLANTRARSRELRRNNPWIDGGVDTFIAYQDAAGFAIQDYAAGALRSISFTSGGTYQVRAGDLPVGATSGAKATIHQVPTLSSGAWADGDAAGTFILENQVGILQAENLNVEGNLNVATIAGNSAAYSPDRQGVAITREAVIDPAYLVWPTSATADQKSAALAQLKLLGILSDRPAA